MAAFSCVFGVHARMTIESHRHSLEGNAMTCYGALFDGKQINVTENCIFSVTVISIIVLVKEI